MIIYLALLICVIGLVIFFASKNGEVKQIGLHMFWVGLLAFLLIGGPVVNLLRR